MEEQEIQRAYELFKEKGYRHSKDNFMALMENNEDALDDARELLSQDNEVKKKSLFRACWGYQGHYGFFYRTSSGKSYFLGLTAK